VRYRLCQPHVVQRYALVFVTLSHAKLLMLNGMINRRGRLLILMEGGDVAV